jgi:hypothetical protein
MDQFAAMSLGSAGGTGVSDTQSSEVRQYARDAQESGLQQHGQSYEGQAGHGRRMGGETTGAGGYTGGAEPTLEPESVSDMYKAGQAAGSRGVNQA